MNRKLLSLALAVLVVATALVSDAACAWRAYGVPNQLATGEGEGAYLPVTVFNTRATCPDAGVSTSALNAYTIHLPVIPYSSNCWQMNSDAISKNAYRLVQLTFVGTFNGAAVAPYSFDEEVVFLASDIVNWGGQEFGFRLSLSDNVLYGYVQDGSNTVTQGKGFFMNVRLASGDATQHTYAMQVAYTKSNETNTFTWFIDGKVAGTYVYRWQTNFESLSYSLVGTTHRWESGWSSGSLYLEIGNIAILPLGGLNSP
jgi:hypothetical protein